MVYYVNVHETTGIILLLYITTFLTYNLVMANILLHLKNIDYPKCTQDALKYLMSCFSSHEGAAIPGLGQGSGNYAAEVCQEYILFRSRTGVQKTLNAVHELQLLEMLCTCFKEAPTKTKYQIFNLIFGGRGDNHTHSLFIKLVSMALSVSCSPVLDCAAIWMQERGADSTPVLALTKRLVDDYCLLFPDPSQVLVKLPSTSPLFVCNFITSVTTAFTFFDGNSVPPCVLLEHVTDWINQDCTLCCESVRQISIHNTYSSPIPGLTGWCIRGPVVAHKLTKSNHPGFSQSKLSKGLSVLSRLHLGLLQSLEFCENNHMSQYLLSITDLFNIVNSLVFLYKMSGLSEDEPCVHVALERVAQVIQVAVVNGCLRVDPVKFQGFRSLIQTSLPPNRLLQMVVSHIAGDRRGESSMDVS
ncbi:uncharacterized protein C7orf26-like [Gigantopelta aegis]|uniref:uncharacterized protein C7orf26-like n=1 Tax=Gigantopelta aegis TaxID=1735272 RepID=UPI001B88820D|nr:uncharacterized protein C7orf26-like [Gigantopelta aegis]